MRFEYLVGSQSVELEYEMPLLNRAGSESPGVHEPAGMVSSAPAAGSDTKALLLAAASPCTTRSTWREARALALRADWKVWESLAKKHDLLLLAEGRLRELSSLQAVKHILTESRKTNFRTLRHNLELDNLTVQLALLISEARCPVLLISGTPFVRQFYGDLGLREVHEVQLVIWREHLSLVCDILASNGFFKEGEDSSDDAARGSSYSHTVHGRTIRVRLQTDISAALNCPELEVSLWRSAIPYSESAATEMNWSEFDHRLIRPNIFAASPELQWIAASLQAAVKAFEPWCTIADFCQASMVLQRILNWEELAQEIERLGLKKRIARTLEAARPWGLTLPDSFTEAFGPATFKPQKPLLPAKEKPANPLDSPWTESLLDDRAGLTSPSDLRGISTKLQLHKRRSAVA
ncbi:MAG: nucleotidyltransferase family protein [Acidobacteriia bacterium]|nr:nucleotidyltransferase family protein [Terriglobia bacterium]